MLNVKLFQGNTEDDVMGLVPHGGGAEVDFVAQVHVKEDTSSSGVPVIA